MLRVCAGWGRRGRAARECLRDGSGAAPGGSRPAACTSRGCSVSVTARPQLSPGPGARAPRALAPRRPPGVETSLEALPYVIARWVPGGWPAVEAAGRLFNTTTVKDKWGRPVLLFRNAFALSQVEAEAGPKLGPLSPYALPPDG